MEDVKIKLSALWAAAMLSGLMGGLLELMEAGKLQDIMTGEVGGIQITDELLLGMAILMVIPPVMVFLSVTLKDKANRWVNIIFGIVFIGFGLIEMLEAESAYMIFVGIVGLVFSALIIWYAWKWPKQGE
jgi:general stress protein CsbA